jgi:hypothetical protein
MHVDRVAHRLRQGEEHAGRDKDSVDRIMRHSVIDRLRSFSKTIALESSQSATATRPETRW